MNTANESSLKTLKDIRSIMERSARFISLSGWSGVWAGATALAGSYVAYIWLSKPVAETTTQKFLLLAAMVFLVALAGAYYFTWRKVRAQGGTVWNGASRRFVIQLAIPMIAGGVFALKFLYEQQESFIVPILLTFYGLALINGSKYTLSDIKYLGAGQVLLGCISLFMPEYGLLFWTLGFGALHIIYGIIMRNKYDKHTSRENA
ncbi:MAG: hypothetical protein K0R82_2130 [Flavipsychrobacter sp.]|jgi:hypothetical protein|nr:hypothetical protein [Flavipsychrobacter sp.]